MNKKIRISVVSYTNTLPFRWALKHGEIKSRIVLEEDIPSICAQKLKYRQVDLALVPVALIPELDEYHVESGFCIGADGRVDSVKLYSQTPLAEIKNVYLDYQSLSSVTLTRVLFKFFWKRNVNFIPAKPGFENKAVEGSANVVIGDRTFSLNGTFSYEYDLAEEWKKVTGLPFVFAAWLSNEKLDGDFIREFDRTLAHGLKNIGTAIEESKNSLAISAEEAREYLDHRISYVLDGKKKEAMELFLKYIRQL